MCSTRCFANERNSTNRKPLTVKSEENYNAYFDLLRSSMRWYCALESVVIEIYYSECNFAGFSSLDSIFRAGLWPKICRIKENESGSFFIKARTFYLIRFSDENFERFFDFFSLVFLLANAPIHTRKHRQLFGFLVQFGNYELRSRECQQLCVYKHNSLMITKNYIEITRSSSYTYVYYYYYFLFTGQSLP